MKRERKPQGKLVEKLNNISIKNFLLILIPLILIVVAIPLIISACNENEDTAPEILLCEICEEDPCICEEQQICTTCGEYPCICPASEESDSALEQDPTASACEVCNEYPCICEESEVIAETGFYNPLTGLPTSEDISNNRPMAVMIDNVRAGLPQQGTSRADIIYETLVEGASTRTVAIFQDVSDVGVIGAVRSARAFFVDVVQGHDAIYFHAGGSPEAIDLIRARRLNTFNHNIVFFRDSSRRATHNYEHTLMTTGDRILQGVANSGFRTEHEPDYEHTLVFADDATPPNGSPANRISVSFSAGKSTTFIYNEATNVYAIEQFGNPHVDGNDNTQLTVSNVIVLRTDIRVQDAAGRQNIRTLGRGSGYFFTNGQYAEINWTREREGLPYTFTFEDGSPLILNRGRTYICVIPMNQTVDIS